MTLPDDHPDKWQYPEHTAVKHLILDKYLKTWISIRGGNAKTLAYIDGFAGRGIYQDGSPGSPIIAMRAGQDKINNIRRGPGGMEIFHCIFVEKNEDNYLCLKSQVESLAPSCGSVTTLLRCGTFEETAREFIKLSDGTSTIPTLFFIDPFGWDGVPFDAIKGILDNPQTEILLTFMVRDMNRFLESTPHRDSLNKLFGGPCYENCIQDEDREKSLLNLYLNLIRTQTKAEHVLPFVMYGSEVRRPIYYLIFATHHPLGLRKMKDVMHTVGSGDFGFLGPDHEQSLAQTKLPVLNDMRTTWILKHYSGKRIRFIDFLNEVYGLVDDPLIGSLVEPDYRGLLHDMEAEGKVTIVRSKPNSRAINDESILCF